MVDLLGPADAGSVNTLATTTDVTSPTAGDTWFKDCAGGVSGTGTNEVALYINRYLQQLRQAIRNSNAPIGNSYDNMLSWAMQSGWTNWISTAGGSANALSGNADNAPIAVIGGTRVFGVAGATNTGAATFNWSGLGADPIKDISGNALTGGEIVNGNAFGLLRVASHWRLITPMPLSWLLPKLAGIDVQTFDTNGTWTAPAGFAAASRVRADIWAGGGGGNGAGLGGSGGAYERFEFYLGELPGSLAMVVGLGGLGSDNSSGAANLATLGGSSIFASGLYGNRFAAAGGPSIVDAGPALAQMVTPYIGNGGLRGPALAPYNGGPAFFGGGGGAGWNGTSGSPGTSIMAGGGGAVGAAGSVPAGGGGAGNGVGALGGAGGHGRIIVTTLMG